MDTLKPVSFEILARSSCRRSNSSASINTVSFTGFVVFICAFIFITNYQEWTQFFRRVAPLFAAVRKWFLTMLDR